MTDHFSEAFGRLQSDVANQTPAPPIEQIARVARRRHNTRLATMATAVVMAAGSMGWMATNGTPMSADPIDQPTQPAPTEQPDPGFPSYVWMDATDLPRDLVESFVESPPGHSFTSAPETAPCAEAALRWLSGIKLADVFEQKAWFETSEDEATRGVIHHYVIPTDLPTDDSVTGSLYGGLVNCFGQEPEYLFVPDHLGVELYRTHSGDGPMLIAIGHDWTSQLASMTIYIGPGADDADAEGMLDAGTLEGSIAAIAARVTADNTDPFWPTEVPDGVWLDDADVSAIEPSRWTVSEPVAGVAEPTPLCMGLDDLDWVHHQVATSDAGDLVIQYAVMSELSLDLERRMSAGLEACRLQGFTVEAFGGWDGTLTSTTVFKLAGNGERYLLASNHTRNGAVLTFYQGSRVDVPVPAEVTGEVDFSEMALIMRDLAGKR